MGLGRKQDPHAQMIERVAVEDAAYDALIAALRAEHERARKAEEALGWMANNVFGLRLRDKDGEEYEYLADCDDSPVPREGGESFEAWIRDVAAHYQQTLAARARESWGRS